MTGAARRGRRCPGRSRGRRPRPATLITVTALARPLRGRPRGRHGPRPTPRRARPRSTCRAGPPRCAARCPDRGDRRVDVGVAGVRGAGRAGQHWISAITGGPPRVEGVGLDGEQHARLGGDGGPRLEQLVADAARRTGFEHLVPQRVLEALCRTGPAGPPAASRDSSDPTGPEKSGPARTTAIRARPDQTTTSTGASHGEASSSRFARWWSSRPPSPPSTRMRSGASAARGWSASSRSVWSFAAGWRSTVPPAAAPRRSTGAPPSRGRPPAGRSAGRAPARGRRPSRPPPPARRPARPPAAGDRWGRHRRRPRRWSIAQGNSSRASLPPLALPRSGSRVGGAACGVATLSARLPRAPLRLDAECTSRWGSACGYLHMWR